MGELHVYNLADKIGKISLHSKEMMVTDIKVCPDTTIVCGTS